MNETQLFSIIIIMFGLLGVSFLIIKEKTVSKKVKIWTLVLITLICMIGTSVIKVNIVHPEEEEAFITNDIMHY
jgi:hypothetical protein